MIFRSLLIFIISFSEKYIVITMVQCTYVVIENILAHLSSKSLQFLIEILIRLVILLQKVRPIMKFFFDNMWGVGWGSKFNINSCSLHNAYWPILKLTLLLVNVELFQFFSL